MYGVRSGWQLHGKPGGSFSLAISLPSIFFTSSTSASQRSSMAGPCPRSSPCLSTNASTGWTSSCMRPADG